MAAVKVDGLVLEYTGEFKKDKFIVLRAGQQNPEHLNIYLLNYPRIEILLLQEWKIIQGQ